MSWKSDEYITLHKLKATDNPKVITPSWQEWNPASSRLGSAGGVPQGFNVSGRLLSIPQVGSTIRINSEERNGEKAGGILTTSTIQKITFVDSDTVKIETENSIFLLVKTTAPPTAPPPATIVSGEGGLIDE